MTPSPAQSLAAAVAAILAATSGLTRGDEPLAKLVGGASAAAEHGQGKTEKVTKLVLGAERIGLPSTAMASHASHSSHASHHSHASHASSHPVPPTPHPLPPASRPAPPESRPIIPAPPAPTPHPIPPEKPSGT